MESVFYNGGMIGATLDFGATDQYIVGFQDVVGPPTLVGATSAGLGTGSPPTALTLPSGLQQGDLVIVMIASDSATVPSLTAGWTNIYNSTSNSVGIRVAYKIMTATPDTTYTTASGGGIANAGLALAYRGVNPASIFDATTTTATTATNSQPDGPSITTVTNNSLVLSLVAIDDNNNSSPVPPSGYSLIAAVGQAGSVSVAAAGITKTTAGAENPGAYSGYAADTWHAVTIALKAVTTQQPIYGNLKNSGVWNIQAAYEEVYSNLVLQPVFTDTFETYSGWSTYGTGVIQVSSTRAYEGTQSILKTGAQGDPNGGFKLLGTTLGRPFTLECWIYSVGPRSVGTSDRIFISDSSYNGYGFNVNSGSSINVERRTGGTGTALTNSTSWTRTDNVWFRVKLVANVDNTFTMTVFNAAGTQLATVTSVADTTYTGGFDRIVIVGGYDYHVDNIRIWNGVV